MLAKILRSPLEGSERNNAKLVEALKAEKRARIERVVRTTEHRTLPVGFDDIQIFIPDLLYERVNNPQLLRVIGRIQKEDQLGFYIIEVEPEHADATVAELAEEYRGGGTTYDEKPQSLMSVDIAIYGSGVVVDRFYPNHARYDALGKGIAEDFYHNMEDILEKLGFMFIIGNNTSSNVGFFIEKLDRFPSETLRDNLSGTDIELTGLLSSFFTAQSHLDSVFTIRFFDPVDAEKYIKPEYLQNNDWRTDSHFPVTRRPQRVRKK